MLLDMVEVFDIGRATMGGRYFVTCRLSWEMQVHLSRISRRPKLVKEIIATVQEVFESGVFGVNECDLLFRPDGVVFQHHAQSGASVGRKQDSLKWNYESGNIDSWNLAYFFYICLQRALNLVKEDIIKYANDHELAEEPTGDGIIHHFRRELPAKRRRKT